MSTKHSAPAKPVSHATSKPASSPSRTSHASSSSASTGVKSSSSTSSSHRGQDSSQVSDLAKKGITHADDQGGQTNDKHDMIGGADKDKLQNAKSIDDVKKALTGHDPVDDADKALHDKINNAKDWNSLNDILKEMDHEPTDDKDKEMHDLLKQKMDELKPKEEEKPPDAGGGEQAGGPEQGQQKKPEQSQKPQEGGGGGGDQGGGGGGGPQQAGGPQGAGDKKQQGGNWDEILTKDALQVLQEKLGGANGAQQGAQGAGIPGANGQPGAGAAGNQLAGAAAPLLGALGGSQGAASGVPNAVGGANQSQPGQNGQQQQGGAVGKLIQDYKQAKSSQAQLKPETEMMVQMAFAISGVDPNQVLGQNGQNGQANPLGGAQNGAAGGLLPGNRVNQLV